MYEILKKLLFCLEPETAHELAIKYLKRIKDPSNKFTHSNLNVDVLGSKYSSVLGMAAGFDKNCEVLCALFSLGFGFVEYGAITPLAQAGNPKPRLWRLIKEQSLQNAMGFNNVGLEQARANLAQAFKCFNKQKPVLWANLGKNKQTANDEAISDYLKLASGLNDYANAFVINISSPNTPNLRSLLNESFVKELLNELTKLSKLPILLKLSPDMSNDELVKVSKAAIDAKAAGLVLTNTTQNYSHSNIQKGGISGQLLAQRSKEVLRILSAEFFGSCVLVNCGGINSAQDALERVKMGASLLQALSGFIYAGPNFAHKINSELANLVAQSGASNISELVGIDKSKVI